jgi:hypothetical protein
VVTAPARGRQARMDTKSSRRVFILDPLCLAAHCETQRSQRPTDLAPAFAEYPLTSVTCKWTIRVREKPCR